MCPVPLTLAAGRIFGGGPGHVLGRISPSAVEKCITVHCFFPRPFTRFLLQPPAGGWPGEGEAPGLSAWFPRLPCAALVVAAALSGPLPSSALLFQKKQFFVVLQGVAGFCRAATQRAGEGSRGIGGPCQRAHLSNSDPEPGPSYSQRRTVCFPCAREAYAVVRGRPGEGAAILQHHLLSRISFSGLTFTPPDWLPGGGRAHSLRELGQTSPEQFQAVPPGPRSGSHAGGYMYARPPLLRGAVQLTE